MKSKIKKIIAREILDSRGNPTVEVDLTTESGVFRASVPSGASTGKYEAQEIRDKAKRYNGKGVLKAIKNVEQIIAPKLKGRDVIDQEKIDQLLVELDGTENKSRLGANAILPVSIAVCRAAAAIKGVPLYFYISEISKSKCKLPVASFNVINGGAHAGNDLAVQEFMIAPRMSSFKESLRVAVEIYHSLKEILKKNFGKSAVNIGDEGGFAPPLTTAEQALDLLVKAISKAGYKGKVGIMLDVAASEFYKKGKYEMKKAVFTKEKLLAYYLNLVKKYPIIGIEDPFSQDDWTSFAAITEQTKKNITIIGDDLLCTNPKRIKQAKDKQACNGIILKPNQIGTVTEALEAAKVTKSFGWKIMVSHRSGETNDDFIADLAVGLSANFIKTGAPTRGERLAKYNRLLRIEQEL
ncbi:phosphopyruvate hydratase [Candidatus Parcubacteria bacterium]|nr:phosphopyruvate hydratase [Candidatus Parcubacteria bacterium]